MPAYLFLFSPEAQAIHGQALDAREFDAEQWLADYSN
jgi:hypothetical protein